MRRTEENGSDSTVLIVDDKPEGLRLLSAILESRGYTVRTIPESTMVLPAVLSTPPDVVLLDILMPDMDGYAVCAELKKNEQTRDIPVIFISALNETVDKVKGFEVGGVDYISKPFFAEEVLARIGTHLTLRKAQRSLEIKNRELEKREAGYRRLVENHPGIIYSFSPAERGFRFVSGRVEKVLGYSSCDITANPSLWHGAVHPDDKGQLDRVLKGIKDGEDFAVEYRIRDRGGKWHWFHDRSIGRRMDTDDIVMEGMAMDVTEGKQVEEKLRESRHEYRRLLEEVCPFAMHYSRLPSGEVTYISPSVRNIMGLDPKQITGRRLQDIVRWESESIDALLSKSQGVVGHVDAEVSFYHMDGSLRTLGIIAHPVRDEAGNVTRINGMATDITDRKLIEREKDHINMILEAKVKERTFELEKLNTTLTVLLKQRGADKLEVEGKVLNNYKSLIKPFLGKLRERLIGKDHLNLLNTLETNMEEMVSSFSTNLSDPLRRLTPSEIQVAALVKQGLSNKEIAATLNNSVRTVTNHRSQIRKKLDIQNKRVNLRSLLTSMK